MGTSNLRHSLEKRYSALTGQLQDTRENIARIRREIEKLPELEARLPKLEALIESAALLLSDIDPHWRREETPAIKPWTHQLVVPFGTCGRRGMEVLRKAAKPMTSRQVAVQVLREVGNDHPDPRMVQRTLNAIEASFRKHKGRTVVSSGKYPAQWRSIANPQIEFGP